MNRFARWLVKHRVVVVIVCLALMIPSVFGMMSTKVKYDRCIICLRIWTRSRARTF